jgi:hypothetical protein
MTTYNPDLWATTMWRALKTYIDSIVDDDIYTVVLGYPTAKDLDQLLPLKKTIIHFDIEDAPERPLGLGDNYVDASYNDAPPPDGQMVEYWEAHYHEVLFDIGVWASAESGGVTSRLEARMLLTKLFTGTTAYEACMAVTDGVHIHHFSGGRNLTDASGDIPLWRMVDIALTVQVFSRTKVPPVEYIAGIVDVVQEPEIEIGGIPIEG